MSSPEPMGEAGGHIRGTRASADQRLIAQFKPIERELLRLLAQGLDTEAITRRLGIAGHTAEWHIRHVIEKLQVDSRQQAVAEAVRNGLIEL
jgi:DNA-binding CsgD family transcriptional regulator